ncbi:MAG: hypothetical protein JO033_27170 [Acidobacteriaceae bacterium]|nr:hypothetical protein [Acidobacteriaceae bacterium]
MYGESTGYFLTCGAFAVAAGANRRRWEERLRLSEAWLRTLWSNPLPQTRHYLSAVNDWRNHAVFTFDCAIMLRGLASRESEGAQSARRAIMEQLSRHIGDDGTLLSHFLSTGNALPTRWSTAPGPYLVKAAAALLSTQDSNSEIRAAAERTVRRWQNFYATHELAGDLHPLLYYLEGLFLLSVLREPTECAAPNTLLSVYTKVLLLQRSDGSLPQNVEDPDSASRADVIAQALRLGCLLLSAGYLRQSLWMQRLERLAHCLETFIDESGGVRFQHTDGTSSQLNVWCTIFSYQALLLYGRIRHGHRIEEPLVRSIA